MGEFMPFSGKKIIKYLGVLFAVLIAFVIGEIFGSKWAILNTMELQSQILINNGVLLSDCRKNGCGDSIQKMIVHQNDIAIQQYNFWERAYTRPASRFFYYAIWPAVNYYAEGDEFVVPTGERIRNLYKRLGCGLNGILCNNKN